ncbi:hypothetical protein H8959_012950 [Pygathrix nigripes]
MSGSLEVAASDKVKEVARGEASVGRRVHWPSQYRQLQSDYGPPSLGYTRGAGKSQVPQSKYAELLAIIEELGKEIRPTYAGSESAVERLKRCVIARWRAGSGVLGRNGTECQILAALLVLKDFHLFTR